MKPVLSRTTGCCFSFPFVFLVFRNSVQFFCVSLLGVGSVGNRVICEMTAELLWQKFPFQKRLCWKVRGAVVVEVESYFSVQVVVLSLLWNLD